MNTNKKKEIKKMVDCCICCGQITGIKFRNIPVCVKVIKDYKDNFTSTPEQIKKEMFNKYVNTGNK